MCISDKMNLQILHKNNVRNVFKAERGFSRFIKISKENVLFNMGDGNILLHNIKIAGINPEKIEEIKKIMPESYKNRQIGFNFFVNKDDLNE
jgi:hypothetical protein